MRVPMSPLALGALVVVAGGNLAGVLWLSRVLSRDAEATVKAANWTPAGASSRAITAPAPTPPTAYAETLNRPAFFKDRKPYAPPPPPAPPPSPPVVMALLPPPPPPPASPEPELELAGVAITGEMKRAYLVPKSGGDGVWVKEGEEINGWRIHAITKNRIDMQNAGRTAPLRLYEKAQ